MNETEEQFKKDFEASQKTDLSFDKSQLVTNAPNVRHRMSTGKKVAIILSCSFAGLLVILIGVPLAVLIGASLRTDSSVKEYTKKYSMNEVKIAESNTFKSLNNVLYPDKKAPERSTITSAEKEAYDNFASKTYHALVDTSKQDNMSYNAIGLYSNLNDLEYAATAVNTKELLNDLLGLDEAGRINFYNKMMLANSYAYDNNSIQVKNSAFFSNKFDYNPDYVGYLSQLYCEAYELDFMKAADKMVEWVNEAVNEKGFIDKNFLDLNEETCLYLFSTLYFKNAWSHKYLKANNLKDDFYLSADNTIKADYMRHSYFAEKYYDYGSYVSFKDYYAYGYASITYLVPKSTDDSIYDLTKNVNIFSEDEEKAVRGKESEFNPGYYNDIAINLQTPKFSLKAEVGFNKALESLGFTDMFDRNINTFGDAFTDESTLGYNMYLQKIKQKNEVAFNEDGTVVKSVSMGAMGGAMSADPMEHDTLDVKLNQPFIYIIRDINDTPIFVGHVDDPTR